MNAHSVPCPTLDPLPSTLVEASARLAFIPSTPLGQPWAEAPEPRFRPATVTLARDAAHLGVWADLTDEEIFNDGTLPTQPLWALGDVFEIFLRPAPGERYIELHVTPNNVQLRLAFPSELFFWREATFHGRKPWVWNQSLGEDAFLSEAALRPGGWQVWARIPWTTLTGGTAPQNGEVWTGCFCRYDACRHEPQPVISTTGSHPRPQFHDQRGWNPIIF